MTVKMKDMRGNKLDSQMKLGIGKWHRNEKVSRANGWGKFRFWKLYK